ncbi:MAG: hypothetical protein H6993_11635 [Pseudomonadales bacterium]|nr:hypothetical protein [Pseudomonadales bacterium]
MPARRILPPSIDANDIDDTMRRVPALVLLLILAGCGFHLRGVGVEAPFQSFHLEAPQHSQFAWELRQTFRIAGASEVTSMADADVTLEILDERDLQRAVSTTGNARVAEYEIEQGLLYRLRDGTGEIISEPDWLSRTRVFRVDRDNLVSNSEEQSLIQRELRTDLCQSVLRMASAAVKNRATPARADAG